MEGLGLGRKRYLYYPQHLRTSFQPCAIYFFYWQFARFAGGLFCSSMLGEFRAMHGRIRCWIFLKKAYGKMALGIVQGASCPDDPGYFGAERHAIVPYGLDIDVVKPRLDASARWLQSCGFCMLESIPRQEVVYSWRPQSYFLSRL